MLTWGEKPVVVGRGSHRSGGAGKKKKPNKNWENVDSLTFDVSSCSEDEETLEEMVKPKPVPNGIEGDGVKDVVVVAA